VEVDHDLQAYFPSPVHSLYEVGILSSDIRLVVFDVDSPVTQRDAYSIEACCLHIFEVIAADEGSVTDVSGVFAAIFSSTMLTSSGFLAFSDIALCPGCCINSTRLVHTCCGIARV